MLTCEAGLDAFCIVRQHEPMETEVKRFGLKLICLCDQPEITPEEEWTWGG